MTEPTATHQRRQLGTIPIGPGLGDRLFRLCLQAVAASGILVFLALFYFLFDLSRDAFSQVGLSGVLATEWNPLKNRFGILPFIVGTVASSALALLLAAPVSVGCALFLQEIAPKRLAKVLGFLVELLAAIPSVVYGIWGIFVLAPAMRKWIQPSLKEWLGPETFFSDALGHLLVGLSYPLLLIGELVSPEPVLSQYEEGIRNFADGVFRGTPIGLGLLSSGVVLAVMITPTVTALSREVLGTVPVAIREAALGLGATRWEMVKLALIRSSRAGLVGALVLGLGRAMGETMAVTMVIGNRNAIPGSLFDPAQTMASVIANEYNEADGLHLSSLAAVGVSLFVISLVVNSCARLLVRWLERAERKA